MAETSGRGSILGARSREASTSLLLVLQAEAISPCVLLFYCYKETVKISQRL
jgi:hypothetical protein